MIYMYIILCCLSATYAEDADQENRIVAGDLVDYKQLPYAVFFNRSDMSKPSLIPLPKFLCSGSIIASNWVLTAGHCLWTVGNTDVYTVYAGIVVFNLKNKYGQIKKSNYAKVHDPYLDDASGRKIYIDLGLIRTSSHFKWSSYVTYIKVSRTKWGYGETRVCQAMGFGRTYDDWTEGGIMTIKNVTSGGHSICGQYTWDRLYRSDHHYNWLCIAHEMNRGPFWPGLCKGDSGSGLVFGDELVGVALGLIPNKYDTDTELDFQNNQFQKICGSPHITSYFLDIVPFRSWLPVSSGGRLTSFKALCIFVFVYSFQLLSHMEM